MSNSFLRLFSCGIDCGSRTNVEDSIVNIEHHHSIRHFFRGRRRNADRERMYEVAETGVDAIQTQESTAVEGSPAKSETTEMFDICSGGQGDSWIIPRKDHIIPSPCKPEKQPTNDSNKTMFSKKFAPVVFNPRVITSPLTPSGSKTSSPDRLSSTTETQTSDTKSEISKSNIQTEMTFIKAAHKETNPLPEKTPDSTELSPEPLKREENACREGPVKETIDALSKSSLIPTSPSKPASKLSVLWKNKTFKSVTPKLDTCVITTNSKPTVLTEPETITASPANTVKTNIESDSIKTPVRGAVTSSPSTSKMHGPQPSPLVTGALGQLKAGDKVTPPKVAPKPAKKVPSANTPIVKPLIAPAKLKISTKPVTDAARKYDNHYPNAMQPDPVVNQPRGQSPFVTPKQSPLVASKQSPVVAPKPTWKSPPVLKQPNSFKSAPRLPSNKPIVQETHTRPKPPKVMAKPQKGCFAASTSQKSERKRNNVAEDGFDKETDLPLSDSDDNSPPFSRYYPKSAQKPVEIYSDERIGDMAGLSLNEGWKLSDRSKSNPMPDLDWHEAKQKEQHNINQSANTMLSILVQEHNSCVTEKERVKLTETEIKDQERVNNAKDDSLAGTDKMFAFMEVVPPALLLQKLGIFMTKTKLNKAKTKSEDVYAFLLKRLQQYLIVDSEMVQGGRKRTKDDLHAMFELEKFKTFLCRRIYLIRKKEKQLHTNMEFDKYRAGLDAGISRMAQQEYTYYKKRRDKKSTWFDKFFDDEDTDSSHRSDKSKVDQKPDFQTPTWDSSRLDQEPNISSPNLDKRMDSSKDPQKSSTSVRHWDNDNGPKESTIWGSHWDKSPGKPFLLYRNRTDNLTNGITEEMIKDKQGINIMNVMTKKEMKKKEKMTKRSKSPVSCLCREARTKKQWRKTPPCVKLVPDRGEVVNKMPKDLWDKLNWNHRKWCVENPDCWEIVYPDDYHVPENAAIQRTKPTQWENPKKLPLHSPSTDEQDERCTVYAVDNYHACHTDSDSTSIKCTEKPCVTSKVTPEVTQTKGGCAKRAGKMASGATSTQTKFHKNQPVSGGKQIVPPVTMLKQEPVVTQQDPVDTNAAMNDPSNVSKKTDDIDSNFKKKRKRDRKWWRSKSATNNAMGAESDVINKETSEKTSAARSALPEYPALEVAAEGLKSDDVNWPPAPPGDFRNYVTFSLKSHPAECDVCESNRQHGGIDGLVNRGFDKHGILEYIDNGDLAYHEEPSMRSFEDKLGRKPTRMELFRYAVDGYVHIPIKQLPRHIQELETLHYNEEKEEGNEIVENDPETSGDRRRRMRQLRARRIQLQSGAIEDMGEDDQPPTEPQLFIPDGATFNFSSLEVGPGHGDRPNKRKLQEVLKEKVKTKGEPNKHLINKSDFSKFYIEYLDDDDEDDDVVEKKPSVMGGDVADGEDGSEAPVQPPPLMATELLQFSDDREFNMVPEEIIRKEDETKLKDIEDKYTPTKKMTPNKRNKPRKDKKNARNVTLDFFN